MAAQEPKMILPTGKSKSNASAFTLVELMLVMATLLIVVAVAFPSLKNFFRGRNLDAEAHRLLALTRYGQSRAVSEGVPMVLWIDAENGRYGLQTQTGYADTDAKAVQFTIDDQLTLEVSANRTGPATRDRHRCRVPDPYMDAAQAPTRPSDHRIPVRVVHRPLHQPRGR